MSNDYQSSNKPFPDNHMAQAFTPDGMPKPAFDVDLNLADLDVDHLDEEIDALAVLEASSHKPVVTVSPPPVTAPTLPNSPVLPSFPEFNTRTEPVVSQARAMPDLATLAPSVTAPNTVTIQQPPMVEAPAVIPTPVIPSAEQPTHTPAHTPIAPTEQRFISNPLPTIEQNNNNMTDGVIGTARVVTQPSAQPFNHSAVSDNTMGNARAVTALNKAKVGDNGKEPSILEEPAVNVLQKVINAYNLLEQQMATNKAELEDAYSKLQTVKEKKLALEAKLHEITPPGLPAPLQSLNGNKESILELDSLYQEVKESKINTQNRSCDTVIEYAKSIRKHIVGDSSKAEEFLRPLTLSCEILKTNIQHVRTLEQVVELMEIKKNLTHKRNEVHKTISLLMGQIA